MTEFDLPVVQEDDAKALAIDEAAGRALEQWRQAHPGNNWCLTYDWFWRDAFRAGAAAISAEPDLERVRWRTEYDDPEAVLALVRDGADEAVVRDALKAFAESVRLAGGLDMQDFEFMIENTAKAFDCVTNGRVSKPNTLYTVIEQIVSERIERAIEEALAEDRSRS